MLKESPTYTTIPVSDVARATRFYGETLGCVVDRVTPGGTTYVSGETRFFVYPTTARSSGAHTQMRWVVADIRAQVADLKKEGVFVEEYDLPGLKTVDGIADMGDELSCWFRDPDGNLLSFAQVR
jgi:catechol 2,3-dioxygenase-like lactoylglutathione lyase family enzyme